MKNTSYRTEIPESVFKANFVRNGKFFTSFGTASGKNLATIDRCHSVTETMFIYPLTT